MFEYIVANGERVTINPKMITIILESDKECETLIYTADSPEPIRVQETYERINKAFQKFNYSVQTIINVWGNSRF